MSIPLKAHLQYLTTLSKQLRRIETRTLNRAQSLRIEMRLRQAGIPARQMARIMKRASRKTVRQIQSSSIRVDSDIIVPGPPIDPGWLKEADEHRAKLHTIRAVYLRRELRAGYLAYAFLRNMPFDRVEWHAYEPVPLDRIEELIGEYGDASERQITAQRFAEWISAIRISIDEGRHPAPTKNEAVRERRREAEQATRMGW